ncbi:MAG TPA: (deoxy)nucleoside triphosphate pyrophosphohydrolase, partial [bacterium]|nr:(deoxy)nucleoside triphosphate pyrophosphohydrolase [bacterium]
LIPRDGRLLISRRPQDVSFPGLWEFPGGKPEEGEDLQAALCRECKEELGVDVEVIRPIARVNQPHDGGHITLEVFLCQLPDSQEPACLEVDEIAWVTPVDLLQYQFPPANGRLIVQLAALEIGQWIHGDGQLWI